MSKSKPEVLTVDDRTFPHVVLRSELPVIVDFWLPQCLSCITMDVVVQELAASYEGKVTFVKANLQQTASWGTAYGVFEVPTILLVNEGDVKEILTGTYPYSSLKNYLENFLRVIRPI